MRTPTVVTLAICMASVVYGQSCSDIDTQACKLMASKNPELCLDPKLGQSACPRFCNLCPLECYHCDHTLTDTSNCTTTRTCATDEKCLLKQFKSSADGHVEYVMGCSTVAVCDGVDPVMVGRRDIQSRDLSLSCCSTDRCNNPSVMTTATMTTTTTQLPTTASSCARDLEILVEDGHHRSSTESHQILNFLKAVVGKLSIGTQDTLVGLALFDTNVHDKFELTTNLDQASVLREIDDVHFHHHTDNIDYGDVAEFLNDHFTGRLGNRPTVRDVILILSDTGNHHDTHHIQDFHTASANKIVINLNVPSAFNALASNPSAILNTSPSNLMNYVNNIVSQICS